MTSIAPMNRRDWIVGASAALAVTTIPAMVRGASMPPARRIRAGGVTLSMHDVGSGPAVVLLHGFPGLAYTWRHQVAPLAAAGYRVIVPDLRGYGASDAPVAVEDYAVDRLAGDVIGVMDALGIRKAAIVGHDWGGLLAWQMPLLHPTRVAAVVGVNTPFIPYWILWLHPDLIRAASPANRSFVADPASAPIPQMRKVYRPGMYVLLFQDGHVADREMARDPRATLRASYRKDLFPASQWNALPPEVANMEVYGKPPPPRLPGKDVLTPTELDVYTAAFTRTGFTPAINWYRNLDRNWAASRAVRQRIEAPSLMVSGRNDFVLRPSMTDGMDAAISRLTRHVVEDCGHWTPEEKPGELIRLMLPWLARLDRSDFA